MTPAIEPSAQSKSRAEAGSRGPEAPGAPGREPLERELIEAPEVERRVLMNATERFADLMRMEHPERAQAVKATPGTDRPGRRQRPVEVRTTGWAFE